MKAKGTFLPASCRCCAHPATAEGMSTHLCVLDVTAVPFPSSFIYQECLEKEKKRSPSSPHPASFTSPSIFAQKISLPDRGGSLFA